MRRSSIYTCYGLMLSVLLVSPLASQSVARPSAADSDAQKTRAAVILGIQGIARNIESAAAAMPATKFGFIPVDGEFHGVRSFARQVKHLSATNYILAAAAMGEPSPVSAGDETGPDSVRTKEEILTYLHGSFVALRRAAEAIGDYRVPVGSTPISPFQGGRATRLALVMEAMVHSYDHYGQMVVYLRMNGVVPPASAR